MEVPLTLFSLAKVGGQHIAADTTLVRQAITEQVTKAKVRVMHDEGQASETMNAFEQRRKRQAGGKDKEHQLVHASVRHLFH